ncbi:MAG: hypothetical protein C0599_16925 [Salinivirgaceae bacterium]|nr:MAG: hypothetical protein C0599_16925 [Salinivirgaceae bacterium]
MRVVLQIVLAIAAVLLAVLLVLSIYEPIEFEQERAKRYKKVIENLKQIRKAQVAYKEVNNRYTASFDTLIKFVKFDSLPLVKAEGTIPEEYIDSLKSRTKAEKLALKQGLIKRDTIKISVKDSLFGREFNVETLPFVPFAGDAQFEMAVGEVTASGLPVKVFEAKVLSEVILNGLNRRLIATYNDGKDYPGLKVGSLEEANNNAGNWE